jgi:hypothetical protein
MEKSKILSEVINGFAQQYFDLMITRDIQHPKGSVLVRKNLSAEIDQSISKFLPLAVGKLKTSMPKKEDLKESAKNIYELSGAVKLSFANRATRTLSTTMGLLWESLANISPYAINPESEFSLKIKGIDFISMNVDTKTIEYQQVKTQHNTLTGSQKSRSVAELSIHKNPVFCACFATNSSWTFSHPKIPRVSGAEFWGRIGIDYSLLLEKVEYLILALEKEYVDLLDEN